MHLPCMQYAEKSIQEVRGMALTNKQKIFLEHDMIGITHDTLNITNEVMNNQLQYMREINKRWDALYVILVSHTVLLLIIFFMIIFLL